MVCKEEINSLLRILRYTLFLNTSIEQWTLTWQKPATGTGGECYAITPLPSRYCHAANLSYLVSNLCQRNAVGQTSVKGVVTNTQVLWTIYLPCSLGWCTIPRASIFLTSKCCVQSQGLSQSPQQIYSLT